MIDLIDSQAVGLGLAIGLGFLVGLEREWAAHKLVGLRSFTLIGATGGLAALLADPFGGWVVAAGALAISAIVISRLLRGGRADTDTGEEDHGTTTLVAALSVYLLGAACVAGYQAHAVVVAGIITLLLHWKQPLHGLVSKIGREEFNAIIRFVLITLVILPILPNRTFGPYDVINPFQTWLLVVLIVGLNLLGYMAFRMLRADSGAVAAGVIGGMISSTAATVSFAGLTRRTPDLAASAAMVILLASTVVYARVAVELLAVAPGLIAYAGGPMGVFALIMLAASGALWPRVRQQRVELPEQRNPARLGVALTFAALFLVITFAVAAARQHFGDDAIYLVALISGLTDVDAMTLSVGQAFSRGAIEADIAWRAIFLATLANLLFKIGAACVLGTAALRAYMLSLGGAALAAGIAVFLLWP
jgi:uncharacterized membrane protein (DUF4010 family)